MTKLGRKSTIYDALRVNTLLDPLLPVLGQSGVSTESPHDILSNTHTDTVAAAVVRGDTIIGDSTPAWNRLAIGGAGTFLSSDGTDPSWSTIDIDDLANTALSDPNADRMVFWDDSDGALEWLTPGAGLSITTNTIDADHDAANNFVANEHVDHTGVTLTAGAGLTGGGDISASRTFDVGAGDGVTVNANDVALTTPGTLAVATGNAAAGNHTHAITSSSNPGAAAAILASDASGFLQLTGLGIGASPASNAVVLVDDGWIGSGAAAGRLIFDTTPATDEIRVATANLDLNGNDLLLDAAGTTYIHAPSADVIELVAVSEVEININGADDFVFAANELQVNPGSSINMADGTTIGQAAGPLLTFDDANNYLEITGCDVGIGTTAPSHELHIENNGNTTSARVTDGSNSSYLQAGTSAGDAGSIGARIILDDNGTSGKRWDIGSGSVLAGGLVFRNADDTLDGLVLTSSGMAAINDTANANMTIGLTINQGANEDEILAFKSSAVAHGITAWVETDTFASFYRNNAATGGLRVEAYSESGDANALIFLATAGGAADTTKSTLGDGIIEMNCYVKNGTGYTGAGSNGNLVTIANNGTTRFIFDAEGDGHADSSWVTFSDARLKKNQRPLEYGLKEIMALRPKRFDRHSGYIDENGKAILENGYKRRIGLIAQDMLDIVPEVVRTPVDDKSFYSLDYDGLIPVLIKAIQEIIVRLESAGL